MIKFTVSLHELEKQLGHVAQEKGFKHIEELIPIAQSDDDLGLLLEVYYNKFVYENDEKIKLSIDTKLKENDLDSLDELYAELEEVYNFLAGLNLQAADFKREQRAKKAHQRELLDIHKACTQLYDPKILFSSSEHITLASMGGMPSEHLHQATAAMQIEELGDKPKQIIEELSADDVSIQLDGGVVVPLLDIRNPEDEQVGLQYQPLRFTPIADREGSEMFDIELNETYARFNYALGLPECAEKSLLILTSYFAAQQKYQELQEKKISIDSSLILSHQQIQLVLERLTKQLDIEGLLDHHVKATLAKFKELIDKPDLHLITSDLASTSLNLLKYLQPVDLGVMSYLIEKTKGAANQIKDRDIILLLGVTGSGKSTTIHFLAGSTMKLSRVGTSKLKHIEPVAVKDDRLSTFVTSPYPRSETRSINAITVNLASLGATQDKEIILCDSPGFGDTAGFEVDLSNGICLVRALQGCHSIKPIILISYQSLGDRLEGLINVANTLAALLPSLSQQLKAFSYVFTKVPLDDKDQINPLIRSKRDSLTPGQRSNPAIVALLDDIILKTEDEGKIIALDPIRDNPVLVFDALNLQDVIHHPSEHFKDFANSEALSKLKEQLVKDLQSFKRSLEYGQIAFASYKLGQFKTLNEMLNFLEVEKVYKESLGYIKHRFDSIRDNIKSIFERIFLNSELSNESDLQISANQIKYLCAMEELRRSYLPDYSHLVQLTQLFVMKLLTGLQKTEVSDAINLNKIKQIVVKFSAVFLDDQSFLLQMQQVYTQSRESIINELLRLHTQSFDALRKCQYDEFILNAQQLGLLQVKYESHLPIELNQLPAKLHQEFCDWLTMQVTQVNSNMEELAKETSLNETRSVEDGSLSISLDFIRRREDKYKKAVESIAENISTVFKAVHSPGLDKYYGSENLTAVTNKIESKIMDYFEMVERIVLPKIWSSNKTGCFSYFYLQLILLSGLRQNYHIQNKTGDSYARIIRLIGSYISEINNQALRQIDLMQQFDGKTGINFDELKNCISGIQNASVFINHPENLYGRELDIIKEKIQVTIQNLKLQLREDLSLEYSEDLSKELFIIERLRSLLSIEQMLFDEPATIPLVIDNFESNIRRLLLSIHQVIKDEKLMTDIKTFFSVINFFKMYKFDLFEKQIRSSTELFEQVISYIKKWYIKANSSLNGIFDRFTDTAHKGTQTAQAAKKKSIFSKAVSAFDGKKEAQKAALQSKSGSVSTEEIKDFCNKLMLLHTIYEKQSLSEGHGNTFLPDVKPDLILHEWCDPINGKLLLNIRQLYEDAALVESGQFDGTIRTKLALASQLRVLDKLLPIDNNYSMLTTRLESAIKSQRISKEQELDLLSIKKDFPGFRSLFLDVKAKQPELLESMEGRLNMLLTEILNELQQIKSDVVSFALNQDSVEILNIILKKIVALKNLEQLEDLSTNKTHTGRMVEIKDLLAESNALLNKKVNQYASHISEQINNEEFKAAMVNLNFLDSLVKLFDYDKVVQDHLRSAILKLKEQVKHKVSESNRVYTDLLIRDYEKKPPKIYFAKLDELKLQYPIFNEFHQQLSKVIIGKISQVLTECKKETPDCDVHEQINIVKELHKYIPLEMYSQFSEEVNSIETMIIGRSEEENRKFKELAAAKNMKGLVDELYRTQHGTRLKMLVEQIMRLITDAKVSYMDQLDKDNIKVIASPLARSWIDWQDYITQLKKITAPKTVPVKQTYSDPIFGYGYYSYTSYVQKNFYLVDPKIPETICHQLLTSVSQTYCRIFNELEKLRHKSINIKKGFGVIAAQFPNFQSLVQLYLEFKSGAYSTYPHNNFYSSLVSFEPRVNHEKMFINLNHIKLFFDNIQDCFEQLLTSKNLSALADMMTVVAQHNHTLVMIKTFADHNRADLPREFVSSLDRLFDYQQMRTQLAQRLTELKDIAAQKILEHKRAKSANAIDRKEFHYEIATAFLSLKTVKPLIEHVDERVADVNKLESEAKSKIMQNLAEVKSRLIELIALIPTDNLRNISDLNTWYDNLQLVIECFDGNELAQEAQIMLNDIERLLNEKLENFKEMIFEVETDTSSSAVDIKVLNGLIQLKIISIHAPVFKHQADKIIDAVLNNIKRQGNGVQYIARMGIEFNKRDDDHQAIAQMIISEHAAFKSYAIELRNEKTLRFGIDDVLESLGKNGKNTALHATKLKEYFAIYEKIYWDLVEQGMLQKLEVMENIIKTSKVIALSSDKDYSQKILELAAHIFAYWTLQNTDARQEPSEEASSDHRKYLLQPHAAQVISIFRLLGVDIEPLSGRALALQNHLVEIGTGEGKSVTMAITAMILALQNYEVDCACYSGYLSERDRNDFAELFRDFGLQASITYGTFNQLSEGMINVRGSIRDNLVELIKNGSKYGLVQGSKLREKVILIDEVDVFFSKDFYGNFYRPLAELRDQAVNDLLLYIWSNRSKGDMLRLATVKSSPAFNACCKLFAGWEDLLEEAVKAMIVDVRSFDTPEYIVKDDKIGYREQHGISFDISYRYKTIFAYFCEHEKGEITIDSRDKRAAVIIDCGAFSYAEVPKQYKCVMGVTGTLSTLSEPERKLLTDVYSINKYTYMPSVYGANQLIFAGDTQQDVKIDKRSAQFMSISNEIKKRMVAKDGLERPVMVFFESTEALKKFYHSSELQRSGINPDHIKVINEELSDEQKSGLIRQATGSGVVTLLTRDFGRGTDFKCYDDRINKLCGGVHVIQTFISDELSEETQIKGRTARQGDAGSYSLVLAEEDLECYNLDSTAIERMKSTNSLYTTINKARCDFFLRQYAESLRYADEIKKDHMDALTFVKALLAKDVLIIKEFLIKRNKTILQIRNSKTICLMDATGSMSGLLDKAKNTVHAMFERARLVLEEKGVLATFELQFVVYRNYNCPEETVLQYSGWESDPMSLQQFMRSIKPMGGMGNEAIEVGLWHVNQAAQSMEIKQVILIGDMPPNSREEVVSKRAANQGAGYWSKTKFSSVTYFGDELTRIKEKNIPIHAFYVQPNAKESFEMIAKSTSGKFGALHIDSPEGANSLTHVVTESILEDLGGRELVESYREKFVKGYVSSSPTKSPVLFKATAAGQVHQDIMAEEGAAAAAGKSRTTIG